MDFDFTALNAALADVETKNTAYQTACGSENAAQDKYDAAQESLNASTLAREEADSAMEIAMKTLVDEAEKVGITLPADPQAPAV